MMNSKSRSPEPANRGDGNFQNIQVLCNSAYYFQSHCIIICHPEKNAFRLVVISGSRSKKIDRTYHSLRTAHMVFGKIFKPFGRDVKQDWTPIYPVNRKWVNKIVNAVPDERESE